MEESIFLPEFCCRAALVHGRRDGAGALQEEGIEDVARHDIAVRRQVVPALIVGDSGAIREPRTEIDARCRDR